MSFDSDSFCDNAEAGATLLIAGCYLAARRRQQRDRDHAERAEWAAYIARRQAQDRYLLALKLDDDRKAKATACVQKWAAALKG